MTSPRAGRAAHSRMARRGGRLHRPDARPGMAVAVGSAGQRRASSPGRGGWLRLRSGSEPRRRGTADACRKLRRDCRGGRRLDHRGRSCGPRGVRQPGQPARGHRRTPDGRGRSTGASMFCASFVWLHAEGGTGSRSRADTGREPGSGAPAVQGDRPDALPVCRQRRRAKLEDTGRSDAEGSYLPPWDSAGPAALLVAGAGRVGKPSVPTASKASLTEFPDPVASCHPFCSLPRSTPRGAKPHFVRDLLRSWSVAVTLVDVGALGTPAAVADVPRERIFELAGTTLDAVRAAGRPRRGGDEGRGRRGAISRATRTRAGELSGVLGLGGSAGTTIGTAAMRALPIGVPKVMVSTLASGQVRQYVGDKDILMLNSVVDILGINRISRQVLSQAARAMAGMVDASARRPRTRRQAAGRRDDVRRDDAMRRAGARDAGAGGLRGAGLSRHRQRRPGDGVADRRRADRRRAGHHTTELADELVGGFLSAGPDRLTAAGKAGVPQVVSAGALDMVNFHAPDTVPAKFKDRQFYRHNANVTLMRTTPEENAQIGAEIAREARGGEGAGRRAAAGARRVGHRPRGAAVRRSRRRGRRCTTRFAQALGERRGRRAGSAHQRSGVRRRGGAEADRVDEDAVEASEAQFRRRRAVDNSQAGAF